MAVTIETLEARQSKLKEMADKADTPHRKRDLTKQFKRVSRRLMVMKKIEAQKAAAKKAADDKAAEAKAAAEEKAQADAAAEAPAEETPAEE